MGCTHREPGRYVSQVVDWWTEEEQLVWVEGPSTQVDISLGAFRCTKCGEVGYYTGNWKRYYEDGVPCAGSDRVSRKLPNYFLYFRQARLLVWHFNLSANHVANMGLMLSTLGGMARVVSYTHVLKNFFALQADQIIEYVDLKVSEPRSRLQRQELQQLDPTDWSFNPFKAVGSRDAKQNCGRSQGRCEAIA